MPASAYATVEQFRARLGALRLSDMVNVAPESEDADLVDLLNSAAARMNSTFARAGYAIPLDLTLITDTGLRGQLSSQLAVANAVLAAWDAVSGVADAGSGLKLAYDRQNKWLANILEGKESLLGLGKAGQAAVVGGRFGVVTLDDDLDRLEAQMSRWSRLGTYA